MCHIVFIKMATPFFTSYTCCSNLSDSVKHRVTEYATLYDLVADVLQAEGKIIDPPKIHSHFYHKSV